MLGCNQVVCYHFKSKIPISFTFTNYTLPAAPLYKLRLNLMMCVGESAVALDSLSEERADAMTTSAQLTSAALILMVITIHRKRRITFFSARYIYVKQIVPWKNSRSHINNITPNKHFEQTFESFCQ